MSRVFEKTEPWARTWEVVKQLGRGGQGTTWLVKHRFGQQPMSVLKLLVQQDDPERRARMRREASALQTLSHEGIPKYIECNTDQFKSDARLFLVLEYVDGPTLEKRIKARSMTLAEAVAMTQALVDIVSYCHERNIGHRDIKPDNIVLRKDPPDRPVLIDFGQSFNAEEIDADAIGATRTNEQMGNRFLLLPEQKIAGADKRDLRSDLTACCGVLYYALTGERPTMLRDAEGRAPYDRETVRTVFEQLPGRHAAAALRLLGRGFRYRIDDRWQTPGALLEALRTIVLPEPPDNTETVAKILATLARTRDEANSKVAARDELAEHAADAVSAFFEPIRRELLRQLERRRNDGLPLHIAQTWADNDTSLPMRELVRIAAVEPNGRSPGVFRLSSEADGAKPFYISLQLVFEPNAGEGFVPVRFVLTFDHDGYQGPRWTG